MTTKYPGLAKIAVSKQWVQNAVGRAAPNASPERLAKFQQNMAAREARMHARSQQHQQAFAQNAQKGNFADAVAHGDRADVASRTADASNAALRAAQRSQGPAPQHPQATPTTPQATPTNPQGQPAQPGTPWSWADKAYAAGAAGLAGLGMVGAAADHLHPHFQQLRGHYDQLRGMFQTPWHETPGGMAGIAGGAVGLGALGAMAMGGGGGGRRYPQPYPPPGYPPQGGYPQQYPYAMKMGEDRTLRKYGLK